MRGPGTIGQGVAGRSPPWLPGAAAPAFPDDAPWLVPAVGTDVPESLPPEAAVSGPAALDANDMAVGSADGRTLPGRRFYQRGVKRCSAAVCNAAVAVYVL